MNEAAKPEACPCCNAMPQTLEDYKCFDAGTVPGWQIRCDSCGLQTCWWHSLEEAISRWNTCSRAAVATTPDRKLYSELIHIAAELARADGFLSSCDEDLAPKLKRADLLKTAERQDGRLKDWANRVRQVADGLSPSVATPPVDAELVNECELRDKPVGENSVCLDCYNLQAGAWEESQRQFAAATSPLPSAVAPTADYDLAPCPFCGVQPKNGEALGYVVHKRPCFIIAISNNDVDAWNTRATAPVAAPEGEQEKVYSEVPCAGCHRATDTGLLLCPTCVDEGHATTRSSDQVARAAAEEIREWIGISGLVDGEGINEVAAIISKRLRAEFALTVWCQQYN